MQNLAKYNKFWIALAAAFGVLVSALAPDPATNQAAFVLTRNELYEVLFVFAGTLGVFQVTNKQ